MNHEVHHLLSLGCLRDLVHFIKHQHGAHGFGRDQGVHNLSTVRGLIDQLMARIGARIRIATERNELEGPSERLCDAVLDEGRFSHARRADKEKTETAALGIGDLGADELENLEFGFVLSKHGVIETLTGR